MEQPDGRSQGAARQRLLYLHARTPSVFSDGLTPVEPVAGFAVEISAQVQEWPSRTVHDALVDGWQVVQVPQYQAPFDDREPDVVGFEFILKNEDTIAETVPMLWQVLDHPTVRGVLISLPGAGCEVLHRHWHCKQPGSGYMQWHQDGTNRREVRIDSSLGLYYPREVTADLAAHRHRARDAVPQCSDRPHGHLYQHPRAGAAGGEGRHRRLYPLRYLARHRRQPILRKATHDQVPLPSDGGERGADLEPRSGVAESAHRLEPQRRG